jgi:hypothetical protein
MPRGQVLRRALVTELATTECRWGEVLERLEE